MASLPPIRPEDPYFFAPQWFRPIDLTSAQQHPWHHHGAEVAARLFPNQFCYVFDFRLGGMVYLSPSIEQVLGYTVENFSIEFGFQQIHPDDVAITTESAMLVHEYHRAHPHDNLIGNFFTLDNRVRHADGRYRRILHQQHMPLRDPNTGNIFICVSVSTDITSHKASGSVNYSYSPPNFPAFARRWLAENRGPMAPAQSPAKLTAREQEVLIRVVRGLTSRQIAYEFGLTEMTIRTYRRNIQEKIGNRDMRVWLEHLPPTLLD